MIGLFKTEVIRHRGPWRGFDDVKFATLEWVWWFNHQRLLEPLGFLRPAEFEEQFRTSQTNQLSDAVLTQRALRETRGHSAESKARGVLIDIMREN